MIVNILYVVVLILTFVIGLKLCWIVKLNYRKNNFVSN
mgnify:CR=1 FL=1